MSGAKEIVIAPIGSRDARALTQRLHYSGTFVRNSCLHLGAFLDGRCEGVMSFGPPMDKAKVLHLVRGTKWHNMLELNRLAFSEALPRNSESRALAVARKLIGRQYPHIEWILSFADGCQCGDGTIYRAAGFDLTKIGRNKTIYEFPTGHRLAQIVATAHWAGEGIKAICAEMGVPHVYRCMGEWEALGARPVPGFQLRYIAFKDQSVRDRLTVPILAASAITEAGAGMFRGESK